MDNQEKLRTVLKYRSENSANFDSSRALGPQVFLSTIPAVMNALLIIFLGNIFIEDPAVRSGHGYDACYKNSPVMPYLYGLIAMAYGLLAVLAYFLMGKQVTTQLRIPVLAVVGLMGYGCVWTVMLGIAAAVQGAGECKKIAPNLYNFTALQVGLTPLFCGIWLLQYGAATVRWFLGRVVEEGKRLAARCCGARTKLPGKTEPPIGQTAASSEAASAPL